MSKVKTSVNEKGQVIVELPVSGSEVTLRSPKGRDIKAIELAGQAGDTTNIGTMMTIVSFLAVEPKLSIEDLDDMDAEDVAALGEALSNFRIFSAMAK